MIPPRSGDFSAWGQAGHRAANRPHPDRLLRTADRAGTELDARLRGAGRGGRRPAWRRRAGTPTSSTTSARSRCATRARSTRSGCRDVAGATELAAVETAFHPEHAASTRSPSPTRRSRSSRSTSPGTARGRRRRLARRQEALPHPSPRVGRHVDFDVDGMQREHRCSSETTSRPACGRRSRVIEEQSTTALVHPGQPVDDRRLREPGHRNRVGRMRSGPYTLQ